MHPRVHVDDTIPGSFPHDASILCVQLIVLGCPVEPARMHVSRTRIAGSAHTLTRRVEYRSRLIHVEGGGQNDLSGELAVLRDVLGEQLVVGRHSELDDLLAIAREGGQSLLGDIAYEAIGGYDDMARARALDHVGDSSRCVPRRDEEEGVARTEDTDRGAHVRDRICTYSTRSAGLITTSSSL